MEDKRTHPKLTIPPRQLAVQLRSAFSFLTLLYFILFLGQFACTEVGTTDMQYAVTCYAVINLHTLAMTTLGASVQS